MVLNDLGNYLIFSGLFFTASFVFLVLKKLIWKVAPVLKKLKLISFFLIVSALYMALRIVPVIQLKNLGTYYYLIIWFVIFYNLFTFIDEIFFDYYLIHKKKYEVPQLLRNLIKIVLVSLFVVLFLGKYIPKLSTGYFASLGVFSIILGLALQSLLADIFAGIIISVNAPIKVRDWVRLEDHEGEIVEINWYNTKIRTVTNDVVVIPNGEILKSKVTNYSKPVRKERAMFTVGVSYDDPPHAVRAAVHEALRGISHLSRKEQPEIFLHAYGDFSIDYHVYVNIEGRNHIRKVRDEFYNNLYYVFRRRGITIPYPVRTVENAGSRKSETLPKLKKPALLDFMDRETFRTFSSLGEVARYGGNEHILVEGEDGPGIFILIEGKVSIRKNGKEIASAAPGTIMGEMSLVRDEPVSADCVTAESSVLFFMAKDAFFSFMKKHRDFTERLAQLVAERELENKKNVSATEIKTNIKKEQKRLFDKILRFMNE